MGMVVMNIDLRHGDCRDVMATMEPESVDAIVSDPPYGLGFMGKEWDHGVPGVEFWVEALRVAKPGAHLLAFGGTRTFHRLAVAIEDAGWEIRDCIMWVYGSGFPKSHNVSKAIDKLAGAQPEIIGQSTKARSTSGNSALPSIGGTTIYKTWNITSPSTEEAKQWDGYGTALKPAWEPIIVARKPLIGTIAENVMQYGTGAINIDACRVQMKPDEFNELTKVVVENIIKGTSRKKTHVNFISSTGPANPPNPLGRWPANLLHDGSSEATLGMRDAARYFFCSKASREDRDDGCQDMPNVLVGALQGSRDGSLNPSPLGANDHPTVKPTDLMTWLCRLVCAEGKVVLDPFCGSGSTGRGAMHAGAARFIGIDLSEHYLEIARRRIEAARHPMDSLLS